MPNILDFIKSIRESFGASIAVYRFGNCYQFYEILKVVYPEAQAFYDGNHVWTKIENRFYDIKGEHEMEENKLKFVNDPKLIEVLSQNKCLDSIREKDKKENIQKYGL